LINACDVFLVLNSTSGLEAMLMKKPMIVVNPGKQLYFDYAKGSGALVAHNSKELSEKISSVLNNPITTVRLLKNAEKTKAIVAEQNGLISITGIIIYSTFKFLEEFLRGDDTWIILGVRISQVLTFVILITAIVIFYKKCFFFRK